MNNLFHFLTDMATNPEKQMMFESNPKAMMEANALSEEHQIALNSGDRAKVIAAIFDELETNELVAVQGAAIWGDPGPDPIPDPDPLPDYEDDDSDDDSDEDPEDNPAEDSEDNPDDN